MLRGCKVLIRVLIVYPVTKLLNCYKGLGLILLTSNIGQSARVMCRVFKRSWAGAARLLGARLMCRVSRDFGRGVQGFWGLSASYLARLND